MHIRDSRLSFRHIRVEHRSVVLSAYESSSPQTVYAHPWIHLVQHEPYGDVL